MERPRLCLVNAPRVLARAFADLGCAIVADLTPDGGDLDVAEALGGQEPGLLVQVETLGSRVLLRGLGGLSCRKVFWALDPHLNGYWQAAYGRLFDLVLSTQTKWDADLSALGQKAVRHLPFFGAELPWTPWERRSREIAFVGRVTAQRPARRWLLDFLERRYGPRLSAASDLTYPEMIAFYRDSRFAPNESITGEINFRLFEAASAGCLVLGQDIGPEQDALFEPGREIEVCAHVAELAAVLDSLLKNPRAARTKALVARERVLREHLPAHRAARLLELAASCGDNAARGPEADAWFGLSQFLLWEAGRLPMRPESMAGLLDSLPPWPPMLAARLRFPAQAGDRDEEALAALAAVLAGNVHAGDADVDLAGSMAALRLSRFDLARQFWFRHLKTLPRPAKALLEPPADPAHLCALWARVPRRGLPPLRAGFPFDLERHLPTRSAECLFLALRLRPGDMDLTRALEALLEPCPGLETMRLGLLSELTLRARTDWRLGLAAGLADLKCFRLEPGLDEIALALENARNQGQEAAFRRALEARDPRGLVSRSLF